MEQTRRVDLAHVPRFALGRLTVIASVRMVQRDDGASEILQPRVMQVLVALAEAEGGVVTRDELTMRCWDGRVVGEDAINRILAKLRGVTAGIGAGSFRVETVARVGYRLLRDGQAGAESAPPLEPEPPVASLGRRLDRRLVIGGAAAAVATTALGGFAYWRGRGDDGDVPADIAMLMDQALAAIGQDTLESNGQATGLLRRIVEQRPDFADGWGALALVYAWSYWGRGTRSDPGMEPRARAAIERATALDPHNAYAAMARTVLMPQTGTWARREAILRDALTHHARNDLLLELLAVLLASVGRWREATPLMERAMAVAPTSLTNNFQNIQTLWSTNRLEEADQALERDLRLFPNNATIWFGRTYIYLFSGRTNEAIAFIGDVAARPLGVPASAFENLLMIARAMDSRSPAPIDAAMRVVLSNAHDAVGFAELGCQFASAFGRLDDAFAITDALYFGRGFDPGEVRFSAEQGAYTRRSRRRTHMLFLPSTAGMRADPRFERLVGEIGLTGYWAETGTTPDYRRR